MPILDMVSFSCNYSQHFFLVGDHEILMEFVSAPLIPLLSFSCVNSTSFYMFNGNLCYIS